MSAPRRWLDSGEELTADERRALGADLAQRAPSEAKRAVRAALALKLSGAAAAAAAGGAARGAAQTGGAAKLVSFSVLKSVGVGFALATVVGASFSLLERGNAAPAAGGTHVQGTASLPRAREPSAVVDESVAVQPTSSSTPVYLPEGRAPRHAEAPEMVHERPPSQAATSESQRVAKARALLRAGQASDALQVLDSLERDEPQGLLVQEREALSIQALTGLGQRQAARERAAQFAARYPASPHLTAVRRAAE